MVELGFILRGRAYGAVFGGGPNKMASSSASNGVVVLKAGSGSAVFLDDFLAGFLGIGLLWLLKAWVIDTTSATELADKVAHILPLGHKGFLFLLTSFLGGLVGGFASLTGSLLRKDTPKSKSTLTF